MTTAAAGGFRPPVSDSASGVQAPVELQWLDGDMVAVGQVTLAAPFVTDPLPRGGYTVWTSGPVWINAGDDDVDLLDETVTTANASSPEDIARAPKIHDGKQWPIAIRSGSVIALKAMDATPVTFRIWQVT